MAAAIDPKSKDYVPERYDTFLHWRDAQGIPVVTGFFIEDVNTVELGDAILVSGIDQAEAAWLIEQINKDEIRHENERALMLFIKQNSPQIHPSLNELIDKFGL